VEASNIEVIRIRTLDGESVEFNIVSGKNLYKINDRVVYIQPDYCIHDDENDIFGEYLRPGGDPSKSKLGSNGRIKAISFNFFFANESDKIYSNGIILPISYIESKLNIKIDETTDLQTLLGITKYVVQEKGPGSVSGLNEPDNFPWFLSVSDEDRLELKKGLIDKCYEDKVQLGFTQKRDGSSITLWVKSRNEYGITSRTNAKKLDPMQITAYKDGEVILHQYQKKTDDGYILGWFNNETKTFYTTDEVKEKQFEEVKTYIKDSWVETGNKYMNKLIDFYEEKGLQLAFRGELVGQGIQNKSFNPDSKGELKIIFYGIDDITSKGKRINYSSEWNLKTISEYIGLEYTTELWEGIYDYDGIVKVCNTYFDDMKSKGILVEGVVIRSKYNNILSTKYINNFFDSKK